jgi:hypothetical protein
VRLAREWSVYAAAVRIGILRLRIIGANRVGYRIFAPGAITKPPSVVQTHQFRTREIGERPHVVNQDLENT